jgi:hypothetical protein
MHSCDNFVCVCEWYMYVCMYKCVYELHTCRRMYACVVCMYKCMRVLPRIYTQTRWTKNTNTKKNTRTQPKAHVFLPRKYVAPIFSKHVEHISRVPRNGGNYLFPVKSEPSLHFCRGYFRYVIAYLYVWVCVWRTCVFVVCVMCMYCVVCVFMYVCMYACMYVCM